MQSGQYQLFNTFGLDSYRQLFKIPGEGPLNKETIWTYQYGVSNAVNIRNNNYPSLTTQGQCGISKSLVDDYLCIDGLPIEKSLLYKGRQYAYSEFEDRDPRLNGTVIKPGDRFRTGPFLPNMISPTGYMINKGFDQAGTEEVNTRIDIMLIRFGEVLLNYAEATFELNENISDNDLNISINLLRNRVGMPHLTNAFVAENNLVMRNEIRRERRVELGMEGFRYDDLLRWKTAEIVLPKEVLGIKIFPAEYPTVNPSALNLTSDNIVIVEPSEKRSFDPSKHYLWPIPLNQMALNPNLEQNPNWY
jgi:starch-binding outer membrane protein, SusD/RagB family